MRTTVLLLLAVLLAGCRADVATLATLDRNLNVDAVTSSLTLTGEAHQVLTRDPSIAVAITSRLVRHDIDGHIDVEPSSDQTRFVVNQDPTQLGASAALTGVAALTVTEVESSHAAVWTLQRPDDLLDAIADAADDDITDVISEVTTIGVGVVAAGHHVTASGADSVGNGATITMPISDVNGTLTVPMVLTPTGALPWPALLSFVFVAGVCWWLWRRSRQPAAVVVATSTVATPPRPPTPRSPVQQPTPS